MESASAPTLEVGEIVSLLLGYAEADNPFSHWGADHLSCFRHKNWLSVSDREIQALGRFFQKYDVELMLAEKICRRFTLSQGIRVTSIPEPPRPEGRLEKFKGSAEPLSGSQGSSTNLVRRIQCNCWVGIERTALYS